MPPDAPLIVQSTDRVSIPADARYGAGTWTVDGDIGVWPLDVVPRMPEDWKTDVTVLRGGGRDRYGNPQPTEEVPLPGCLMAPRATEDPVDRGDLTSTTAVLYAPGGLEVPLRKES